MKEQNNILSVTTNNFLELLVVLSRSEFNIQFINYKDLMAFIAMCKSYHKHNEVLSGITILDGNYSLEMVDAIASLQRKKFIKFITGFISILNIDFKSQLVTMKENVVFINLMREFINDFQNGINYAETPKTPNSEIEMMQNKIDLERLAFRERKRFKKYNQELE